MELLPFSALIAMMSGAFVGVALYDLMSVFVGIRQVRSFSDAPLDLLLQLAVIGYFPVLSWLIARVWRSSGRAMPDWRGTWQIACAAQTGKLSTSGRGFELPPAANRAKIPLSDGTKLGYGSSPAIMCLLSTPAFFVLLVLARWMSDLGGK